MVTATKPVAIKTRRQIGKLAQARRAAKAVEPEPEDTTPLIFKAMESLDGYTYPIMGGQLVLAGAKWTLSRELRASMKQTLTKLRIVLDKKEGK